MPAENDATLKAPLIIATENPEPLLTEILLVKIFRSGFSFQGAVVTTRCSPACLCLHPYRESSHAAIHCFLLFYSLDDPYRRDEPEFYPRRHPHLVLSGLGAAVLSSFLPSPPRMDRAAVQAVDDADPPSSQTGVGASCPLAAHHKPDAGASLSVLAECKRVNLSGTGKTLHRYHFLAPSDRFPRPASAGLHQRKWSYRPQQDLPHPLHTSKESTDATRNPFSAVALAHGLPYDVARNGDLPEIL